MVDSNLKDVNSVNFEHPIQRYFLWKARGIGLSAYLIALAAFQRGLAVSFYYELVSSCERFKNLGVQGHRGELFSISDGSQQVHFYRSLSERVSHEDSMRCEDKQATKLRWLERGVDVADGCVVNTQTHAGLQEFLQKTKAKYFVLKPLNGSLGNGVYRHVQKADIPKTLAMVKEINYLIEEEIIGREYRVYVVNGRVVKAFERIPATVVGNGQSTIEQLVAQQNKLRQSHPYQYQYPFSITEDIARYMSDHGCSAQDVPGPGERVQIYDVRSQDVGGNLVECSDHLAENIKLACIAAQSALGVGLVGLDLIVEEQGTAGERVVFLEANQCPHISNTVFSPHHQSLGNDVAEVLLDLHFPNSKNNIKHRDAAFDMEAIIASLRHGWVKRLDLPVLGQGTMVLVKRLGDTEQANIAETMMRRLGIYGWLLPGAGEQPILYLIDKKTRIEQLARALGAELLS